MKLNLEKTNMKKLSYLVFIVLAFSCNKKPEINQTAEISCGQCHFGLTSKDGCNLAVRFDDKAYFVEGFGIDDFGDAHDKKTGFCEVIRKGEIKGYVKEDKFIASSIVLKD